MRAVPYFLKKKEWYVETHHDDFPLVRYKLTDKAPKKARESFAKWEAMNKKAEEPDEDGYVYQY